MKALVVESEPRAGDEAAASLGAAGHEVVRCHDPAWQSVPCTGMSGGCPVEEGVDVVVLARPRRTGQVAALEDGARCAIRAGVPLVMHGPTGVHPYEEWTLAHVEGTAADLVATAERVVTEPHPALSLSATEAVIETLSAGDHDTADVSAKVYRSATGSRVVVDVPDSVPADAARRAAVWAASRLRGSKGTGAVLDVVVNSTPR